MDKLLIVGADGVLGGNLAWALAGRIEVVGCCLGAPPQIDACRMLPQPFGGDPSGLAVAACREAPDWVVYCGACAASSWDAPEAIDARAELERVAVLAEASQASGARLTVISSDAACRGPRLFQDEASTAAADTPFGQVVRRVEAAATAGGALVARTHVYGWSGGGETFAERLWNALADGVPCQADTWRHATPILATDLAELLWKACQQRLSGLYHLSGAERTTPFRFATELAAVGAFSRAEIIGRPAADTVIAAQAETSLDCRRARRALELPLPLLREGLSRFVEQAGDRLAGRQPRGWTRLVSTAA
jgi:dTDP-4-dehydrorhamnose reductase